MTAELTAYLERAYDALADVVDIAEEIGSSALVQAATRLQDGVNALHSHPDVIDGAS